MKQLLNQPSPGRSSGWGTFIPLAILTWCCVSLLMGVALGDAVKISGFWIRHVTVQSVADGKISYTTATGGHVDKALSAVQGLTLDLYPQIEQAVRARENGEDGRAIKLLEQVVDGSRQAWVRHYAAKLLVGSQARAGRPVKAVRTYLALLQAKAGPFFTPAAPVEAVRGASARSRRRILEMLNEAVAKTPGDERGGLRKLADAAGSTVAGGASAAASATPLPANIAEGPAVKALRRGRFKKALVKLDASPPGRGLDRTLYLRGKALLGLASPSGKRVDYLDAGLCFMRVVVYFPGSSLVGPSLVEAGYVHQKIGRKKIAQRLYAQARRRIDQARTPVYYQRLSKLSTPRAGH